MFETVALTIFRFVLASSQHWVRSNIDRREWERLELGRELPEGRKVCSQAADCASERLMGRGKKRAPGLASTCVLVCSVQTPRGKSWPLAQSGCTSRLIIPASAGLRNVLAFSKTGLP
jgi:hypothetical protein